MYQRFLMGMLDGLTDLNEETEPRLNREMMRITIIGDPIARAQLHDEVGAAGIGGARVEHFGDVRMIQHRQRLAFLLETGDDLPCVHSQFDYFQCHAAADRVLLFGFVDNSHSAGTQDPNDSVGANSLRQRGVVGRISHFACDLHSDAGLMVSKHGHIGIVV